MAESFTESRLQRLNSTDEVAPARRQSIASRIIEGGDPLNLGDPVAPSPATAATAPLARSSTTSGLETSSYLTRYYNTAAAEGSGASGEVDDFMKYNTSVEEQRRLLEQCKLSKSHSFSAADTTDSSRRLESLATARNKTSVSNETTVRSEASVRKAGFIF